MPHESDPPAGGGVELLHRPSQPVSVRFRGEVGAAWAPTAQHRLVEALLDHRPAPIVIDLRGVTRLDPGVVGAILATIDSAADLGVPVEVLLGVADPTGGLLRAPGIDAC